MNANFVVLLVVVSGVCVVTCLLVPLSGIIIGSLCLQKQLRSAFRSGAAAVDLQHAATAVAYVPPTAAVTNTHVYGLAHMFS